MDRHVLDGAVLEARPSWALPPRILIAVLREQAAHDNSFWLICGADVPFDYVSRSVAASSRDAARHFALKWQLEGARLAESTPGPAPERDRGSDDKNAGDRLAAQAEALYRLVDDDALWRQSWPAGVGSGGNP